MAKNSHPARELARRLLTPAEISAHVSPFFSKAWLERKAYIEESVKRNLERVAARKAVRLRRQARV